MSNDTPPLGQRVASDVQSAPKDFGNRLRLLRLACGLTLNEAALGLHVDVVRYGEFERGVRAPKSIPQLVDELLRIERTKPCMACGDTGQQRRFDLAETIGDPKQPGEREPCKACQQLAIAMERAGYQHRIGDPVDPLGPNGSLTLAVLDVIDAITGRGSETRGGAPPFDNLVLSGPMVLPGPAVPRFRQTAIRRQVEKQRRKLVDIDEKLGQAMARRVREQEKLAELLDEARKLGITL